MNILYSAAIVTSLIVVAFVASLFTTSQYTVLIILPYVAVFCFIAGFTYRLVDWVKSPVPFNITTTAGQQRSLPWIQNQILGSPNSRWTVVLRIFLEVVFFRSLFRNTKAKLTESINSDSRGNASGNPKGKSQSKPNTKQTLRYIAERKLWLAGLIFHWSLLFIVIRHFRFFTNSVPPFIASMESADLILQNSFHIFTPLLYLTDVTFVVAVTFLFLRRVFDSKVRYFSLVSDYFPLMLLFSIAATGVIMRNISAMNIVSVNNYTVSMLSFRPLLPPENSPLFIIHLFLICSLLIYFPLSKLMHMGGVFFSPTINMPANSRETRHINPWDHPVKVYSYEDYEDQFRTAMKKTNIPVDKDKPGNDNSQNEKKTNREKKNK